MAELEEQEFYRLVFRGEVLKDQHPAVVRKRLQSLLKLDDERIASLFTGKPVILRKRADAETTLKFQAAFKQAGARLRLLPVVEELEPADAPVAEPMADGAPTADAPGAGDFTLAPVGSDVLQPEERKAPVAAPVSTDHLSLAPSDAPAVAAPAATAAPVPDVSHLTIAPVGERLLEPGAAATSASAGSSDLADDKLAEAAAQPGVLDLSDVHFELAEVGTLLATPAPRADTSPPDTSHLTLETLPE